MWSCCCPTGGICYSKNSVVYNVHIQACIIYILYIYTYTVYCGYSVLVECLTTVVSLYSAWVVYMGGIVSVYYSVPIATLYRKSTLVHNGIYLQDGTLQKKNGIAAMQ